MTTRPPRESRAPLIRSARREDLLAIHRIERTVFPQPWPYAAFERYLEEPGFLVAERRDDDQSPVGYVVADAVANHGRPLGHIKDIAVATDHRGRGIGASLLDRSLAILVDEGVQSVKLEVRSSNARAIALYRDRGFVHRRTIADYYGNDEDALVMVRSFD